MTHIAIDALCSMLQNVPQNVEESDRKAYIIRDFAIKVSEEVLRRAGFKKEQNEFQWDNNLLAHEADVPEINTPLDAFMSLFLKDVPSTLTAGEHPKEDPGVAHEIVFCTGRVLEWNSKTDKPRRVLSYEEAARFIIFWLAEKILQICRKNEWDRVKQLPDLFDRMAEFVVTPSCSGEAFLKQKLGLPYNLDSLLLTVEDLKHKMSPRLYNALTNAALKGQNPLWDPEGYRRREALASDRLGYIVTLHPNDFNGFKHMGLVSRAELVGILEQMGLSLGMTLPPEVKAWYEVRVQSQKK